MYAPGGLGDPDRDLRSPTRGIGTPVCVDACDEPSEQVAAGDQEAPAANAGTRSRPGAGPSPTPTSSKLVTLPPVPTVVPPEVSILIDEVLTMAGNRYLHYRIDLSAASALGEITITANVPEQSWFTECSNQAEQRVCVDSYRGSGDSHEVSWYPKIDRPLATFFEFYVHLDPTTEVGEHVVNHAHVGWGDALVTSKTHVFTVPSLVGG